MDLKNEGLDPVCIHGKYESQPCKDCTECSNKLANSYHKDKEKTMGYEAFLRSAKPMTAAEYAQRAEELAAEWVRVTGLPIEYANPDYLSQQVRIKELENQLAQEQILTAALKDLLKGQGFTASSFEGTMKESRVCTLCDRTYYKVHRSSTDFARRKYCSVACSAKGRTKSVGRNNKD